MWQASISVWALVLFFSTYTTGDAEYSQPISTSSSAETTTQFIAKLEGFSPTAYWDVNAYRIGYGSDTITYPDGRIEKVTKDSTVTKELAALDLSRRAKEFESVANKQIGDIDALPESAQVALTSVAYNYGSLPKSVVEAAKTQDPNLIANAIESLHTQDNGINAHRRKAEANFIRGITDE
jgi:GH24 family phage-related lysozyme (muramidase)